MLEQIGGTFQIAFCLLTNGRGLIQLSLDFTRIKLDQQLAGPHLLAGRDQHLLNLATDLGLNDGAQFGAHRAHDLFRRHAAFAFDHLRLHRRHRQKLAGDRFCLAAATVQGECCQQ